ncbi:MAG TPA: FecR domain-containing protein, partial [Verrucomicrobiae bacterium]|nr:FecR domain-containing protein [Verrucomicrobiae bacterium]
MSTLLLSSLLLARCVNLEAAQTPTQAAADRAGLVLTIEGTVEVARVGTTAWNAAETNLALAFGDTLRTGPRSRATVRLSDLSVLRVNEKTILQIRPQSDGRGSLLDLQTGSSYFFNRSKPSSLQFHTPLISGAIRGTEFNLSADPDGRTTVALIEGEVALNNSQGELVLQSGEEGVVEPGQAPRKTAMLQAVNIIQWTLYYPAVLDPDDLGLTESERSSLADSLAAYRAGDLLGALAKYPTNRVPASDADRILHAALLLAVGQADQTDAALQSLQAPSSLAQALRKLIAAVKHQDFSSQPSGTASEWLAESYYLQSRSKLSEALRAARMATGRSPNFGFAWVRAGELEFSLGHVPKAQAALERGLQLSPRNAEALTLKGFLLAAENRTREAAVAFDEAIATDGALANAWLGRGLYKIHQCHFEEGRQD